MFNKLLLTLVILGNLVALYNVQFYTDLVPFYILLGTYLLSSIIVLFFNQYSKSKENILTNLIERMLSSGRSIVFLTFLSVLDLILFMMLVPDASISYLESELQSSFFFYGLIIFFVPMTLSKIVLEPKGKEIEEIFWAEYKRAVQTTKPSMEFALFILARIQMKITPINRVQQRPEFTEESQSLDDQIITTTFAIDYSNRVEPEALIPQSQNSLFDPAESQITEDVLDKYNQEIYSIVPALEKIKSKRPLTIRPELFVSVIVEKTLKDEQMFQMFKSLV